MNFKKLSIFLAILFCITLTAVSASEDIDSNMTVSDNEIVIGEVDENIASQSLEDDVSSNDSNGESLKMIFMFTLRIHWHRRMMIGTHQNL